MIDPRLVDPQRVKDLQWYLLDEIWRAQQDRSRIEKDWIRYETLYRARPAQEVKTFPFDGASNLVIPVVATDVDTLYARLMGILLEPPGLWSVQALKPEFSQLAPAVEEFLEWAQNHEIKPNNAIGSWLLEIHKLGTGILKQRYNREMKKVYEWRELDGMTWQQQAVIMLKDAPSLHHTRLHDFYVPAGFRELASMPWCAERLRLTQSQFYNRVKAGLYSNANGVGSWAASSTVNQQQQALDKLAHFQPSVNVQLELHEFWLDYDIDGDGWEEALVCTMHIPSQQMVRLDFNPFFNQEKPYSVARFMPDVNSFYGIGMGEMLGMFQEEVTAMHNQRIDNGTLYNSSELVIARSETGLKANEPRFPGKVWRPNDVNAVQVLQKGVSHAAPDSMANEAATRSEGQRRVGVNDYVEAQAGPATTYGTAYTTQQMLLASGKRFGETLREVRNALSESGTRILELYQQFNPRGKEYVALGQSDGSKVAMVLRFPMDLIRRSLLIGVSAIDAETSKDARIRTTTLVMQQLTQYYQGYMQSMSFAMNPALPPPMREAAMKMAQGTTILMSKLLNLYGEQNADEMLPALMDATNAQQQQLTGLMGSLGGGAGMGGGPPTSQGLGYAQTPALPRS